jgi:transposase InsO family protein
MRLFFISLKKSFSCHALTCEIQIGGLSSSVDSALLVRYLSTWESDCVTTSEPVTSVVAEATFDYRYGYRRTKDCMVSQEVGAGLMCHSDRGSHYSSHVFLRELEKYGMIYSMSRKGNCWDNAPTES